MRPGRSLSPLELARSEAALERDEHQNAADTDAGSGEMPAITPPSGAFPKPERTTRLAVDGPAARQVQQVSLGIGISLVGLGLGFLGLRLRRTN